MAPKVPAAASGEHAMEVNTACAVSMPLHHAASCSTPRPQIYTARDRHYSLCPGDGNGRPRTMHGPGPNETERSCMRCIASGHPGTYPNSSVLLIGLQLLTAKGPAQMLYICFNYLQTTTIASEPLFTTDGSGLALGRTRTPCRRTAHTHISHDSKDFG